MSSTNTFYTRFDHFRASVNGGCGAEGVANTLTHLLPIPASARGGDLLSFNVHAPQRVPHTYRVAAVGAVGVAGPLSEFSTAGVAPRPVVEFPLDQAAINNRGLQLWWDFSRYRGRLTDGIGAPGLRRIQSEYQGTHAYQGTENNRPKLRTGMVGPSSAIVTTGGAQFLISNSQAGNTLTWPQATFFLVARFKNPSAWTWIMSKGNGAGAGDQAYGMILGAGSHYAFRYSGRRAPQNGLNANDGTIRETNFANDYMYALIEYRVTYNFCRHCRGIYMRLNERAASIADGFGANPVFPGGPRNSFKTNHLISGPWDERGTYINVQVNNQDPLRFLANEAGTASAQGEVMEYFKFINGNGAVWGTDYRNIRDYFDAKYGRPFHCHVNEMTLGVNSSEFAPGTRCDTQTRTEGGAVCPVRCANPAHSVVAGSSTSLRCEFGGWQGALPMCGPQCPPMSRGEADAATCTEDLWHDDFVQHFRHGATPASAIAARGAAAMEGYRILPHMPDDFRRQLATLGSDGNETEGHREYLELNGGLRVAHHGLKELAEDIIITPEDPKYLGRLIGTEPLVVESEIRVISGHGGVVWHLQDGGGELMSSGTNQNYYRFTISSAARAGLAVHSIARVTKPTGRDRYPTTRTLASTTGVLDNPAGWHMVRVIITYGLTEAGGPGSVRMQAYVDGMLVLTADESPANNPLPSTASTGVAASQGDIRVKSFTVSRNCPDGGIVDNADRGQRVRFTCAPGFSGLGTATRTCNAHGEWTGQAFFCRTDPPSFGNGTRFVDEHSPVGTTVGPPLVANSPLPVTFELFEPGNDNAFRIDPCTGQIYVRNDVLDFERTSSYRLRIHAKADNDDRAVAVGFITIQLNNVNDPPRFPGRQTLALAENAPIGTVSNQAVIASDDENSPLLFNVSVVGSFDTDASLGPLFDMRRVNDSAAQLRVIREDALGLLDFEARETIQLIVRVYDAADHSLFSDGLVTLRVLDGADPPRILPSQFLTIDEDLATAGPFPLVLSTAIQVYDEDAQSAGGQQGSDTNDTVDGDGGQTVGSVRLSFDWGTAAASTFGGILTDGTTRLVGPSIFSLNGTSYQLAITQALTISSNDDVLVTDASTETTYLTRAAYNVQLRARDGDGLESNPRNITVLITVNTTGVGGASVDRIESSGPEGRLATDGSSTIIISGIGLDGISGAVTVTYGPYRASGCAIVRESQDVGEDLITIQCASQRGHGKDHRVTIIAEGRELRAANLLLLSYQPPTLDGISGTRANDTLGETGLDVKRLLTTGGQVVYLRGTGFASNRSAVRATYGPRNPAWIDPVTVTDPVDVFDPLDPVQNPPYLFSTLSAQVIRVSNTEVAIRTAPGMGTELGWMLEVDGQIAYGSSQTEVSYGVAAIRAIAPTANLASSRFGIPSRGSANVASRRLRITGDNFGPMTWLGQAVDVKLRYGPTPDGKLYETRCSKPSSSGNQPHQELSCGVAEGVGTNLTVTIGVNGRWSVPEMSEDMLVRGAVIPDDGSVTPPAPLRETDLQTALTNAVAAVEAIAGITASAAYIGYRPPTVSAVEGESIQEAVTPGGQIFRVLGADFGPADTTGQSVNWVRYGGGGLTMGAAYQQGGSLGGMGGQERGDGGALEDALQGMDWFAARDCEVRSHEELRCQTAPGTGRDHAVAVSIGNQASSVLGEAVISYQPPSVAGFDGPGAEDAVTVGREQVVILGRNLGPASRFDSVSRYFYEAEISVDGQGGGGRRTILFEAQGCNMATGTDEHSRVVCQTAPGAGDALEWILSVDGQNSSYPVTSYQQPSVFSVGLSTDGSAVNNAPTDGGTRIRITGENFGPASLPFLLQRVVYGTREALVREFGGQADSTDGSSSVFPGYLYEATNIQLVSQTEILATLVPGVGQDLVFVVTVADQSSLPSDPELASVSYARPTVEEITPSSWYPNARDNPTTITVVGRDFGLLHAASDVAIAFGNPADYSSEGGLIQPRSTTILPDGRHRVVFDLPSSHGLDRAVRVAAYPRGVSLDRAGEAAVLSSPIADGAASLFDYYDPVLDYLALNSPSRSDEVSYIGNTSSFGCPAPSGANNYCGLRMLTLYGQNFGIFEPPIAPSIFLSVAQFPTSPLPSSTEVFHWADDEIVLVTTAPEGGVQVRINSMQYAEPGSLGPGPAQQVQLSNRLIFQSVAPDISELNSPSEVPTIGGEDMSMVVENLNVGQRVAVLVGRAGRERVCRLYSADGNTLYNDPSNGGVDDPATTALATTTGSITLRCRLPEGEGSAVPVTIQTWTGTDWKRSRVGGSIQYSPPSILRAELLGGPRSGVGAGGAAADAGRPTASEIVSVGGAGLPTVGGVLRIVGDNFGLCPVVLFGAHDAVRACNAVGQPNPVPALVTMPGVLARSHGFIEVRLPAGHGSMLRVDVDVAGQLPSLGGPGARFLRASYDAATVSEVIPKVASAGLPTSGGARVRIIGSNLGTEDGNGGYEGGPLVVLSDGSIPGGDNVTVVNGSTGGNSGSGSGSGSGSPAIRAPDGGPLFRDRIVEMRSLAGTGAVWVSCGAVLYVSHEEVECVLPEGMGKVIDVRLKVGNAPFVVIRGAASYDPPTVSLVEIYEAVPGLSAMQMGRTGLLSAGAMVASGSPIGPALLGNTTGGYAMRVIGSNFGRPFGPSARSPSLCAFLAHTYRSRPSQVPLCNNRESYLGEGEVSSTSILHWWHDEIMFIVPMGAGTRELRLFIAGNLLEADPAVLPNNTRSLPAGVTPMPAFAYRAPWIEIGGMRPARGSTDGGDIVTMFAYNLPPPPLSGAEATAAADALAGGTGVSLEVAPFLPVVWLRVDFWKDCITSARTVDGLFPNDPRVSSCYPRRDDRIDIRQQDMESIVFDSAPGIGRDRQVRLTIVEVNGPNRTSSNFAEWNYDPPQIDGADPSGLAVTGDLIDEVDLVSSMQNQYSARFLGRNFGADEDADRQGWSAEERRLELRIDGQACLPNSTIRARETIRRGNGAVGFRPTVSCVIPELPVGYKEIQVSAAGQNGTSEDILLFACDRGFFGEPTELCLACPRGADCRGHTRLVPQLHADLIIQRQAEILAVQEAIQAYQESISGEDSAETRRLQEGGETPAEGDTDESVDELRSPDNARSLGITFADPRYLNVDITEDDGPWSLKYSNVMFHRPSPISGWYNLNETAQLQECPELFQIDGRAQCIVPCDPEWACTGDNFCATGYRSVGPEWRCNACDEGYYRRAGECVVCPDNPWILIAVFLILMICGIGFVYFLAKYNINLVLTTLGMDYFQVLALFTQSRVPWPPVLEDILHILSAFNLNIEITAPECTVPDLSYISKWLFIMMLPVAGLVCLTLVYLSVSGYEWCFKGKTRTESWYGQHLNRCISMFLVGGYILYLILSRTSFDVLNCQPTTPPDGNLYLQVVFEPCSKPGGVHRTLLGPAIVTLFLYGLGFPAIVFYIIYMNHDLIMEDQLLRAMKQGEDTVTNPNAHTIRRRFSKMYFAFKPIGYRIYWMLALVSRKFFFALTSLLFVRNPVMQLSMSLLVMFAAFAAQTRFHPFMSPDEMEETLRQHKRLSFDPNSPHSKLAASIKAVVSKGRKRATYGQGFQRLTESPNVLVKFGGTVMGAAINYNTIESVLLGSAVLVNLSGIMFSSGQLNTDETGEYYSGYRDSLIALTLLVIFSTLIYFAIVFAFDIYTLCSSASEAESGKGGKGGKKGLRSPGMAGGAGATRRGSTKAQLDSDLPDEEEQIVGVISQQTNPVFARASQRNLLSDSLDAGEAMDGMRQAPDQQQWTIFRDQYRNLQEQVRSLTEQAKDARQEANKAELEAAGRPQSSVEAAATAASGQQRNPMGRRGQRRSRRSVFAPTSSSAGGTIASGTGAFESSGGAGGGAIGTDGAASLASLRESSRGRRGGRI